MLEQIELFTELRRDFAFETTLSGRTYLKFIHRLRLQGYRIHLFFLWLQNAALAISRVAERVRLGGHSVPEDVIRRRYDRGLQNLFHLYRSRMDVWTIFENSGQSPVLVAAEVDGKLRVKKSQFFEHLLKLTEES